MIITDLVTARAKLLELLTIEDQSVLRLEEYEQDNALLEALDLFNVVAPLEKLHEQAGDGSTRRVVLNSAVTGWVKSISKVINVWNVVDANTDDEVVRKFRKENWEQFIDASSDDVLKLSESTPSGDTLRIAWTTRNELKDLDGAAATTIPERYTEAFYLYATSTGAMAVASRAARLKQASFGADQTSFDEVYQRWTDIARKKKRMAEERIGSIRGSVQGTGQSVDWPTRTRFGYGVRISH